MAHQFPEIEAFLNEIREFRSDQLRMGNNIGLRTIETGSHVSGGLIGRLERGGETMPSTMAKVRKWMREYADA